MKNVSMPTKKVISEKLLCRINLCAFQNEKCFTGNTEIQLFLSHSFRFPLFILESVCCVEMSKLQTPPERRRRISFSAFACFCSCLLLNLAMSYVSAINRTILEYMFMLKKNLFTALLQLH